MSFINGVLFATTVYIFTLTMTVISLKIIASIYEKKESKRKYIFFDIVRKKQQ